MKSSERHYDQCHVCGNFRYGKFLRDVFLCFSHFNEQVRIAEAEKEEAAREAARTIVYKAVA